MQKISIAIVLALTLSCAIAVNYTVTDAGWVKKPVTICNDTETTCNNLATYQLVGLTSSDVNFAGWNAPSATEPQNSTSWSVFTKSLVTKDLSSTVNKTYAYKATTVSTIQYGFAIAFGTTNDAAGIPQAYLYQTQLSNNTALPAVQITNNTDVKFLPVVVGSAFTTKSIFVFFSYADKKVNATSYPLGTATQGKMIAITSTLLSGGVQSATGEALSSSQAYITWKEVDTTLKVGIVDFSAGTLTGTADLTGYNKDYACSPYATDKKYYGVFCQYLQTAALPATTINNTIFVSANNTTLYPLYVIADITVQTIDTPIAYGPYLAIISRNPTGPTAPTTTVLSYAIWDLEKFNTTKTKTDFLTIDTATTAVTSYRIPQGGLYYLALNKAVGDIKTPTNIQVGQLMGASYLTSVFGSLLAIIAGLFLF
jgi:hypothetical protein